MRKRLMIIAFVGLALLLLVEPALAAGSAGRTVLAAQKSAQPQKYVISFTGTIQSIDSANKRFSVAIQMTNYPYIAKRGDTEWVYTTGSTVYYIWSSSKTRTRGYFSSLQVGQRVSINAAATTTMITARRVEVNKPRY
jgi:hypothetical protein